MRHRSCCYLLICALLASGATNAGAQERMLLEFLSPGSKLRVAVPPRWIEGELLRVDRAEGRLVLAEWWQSDGTHDVSLDQVTAVEYRHGTRRVRSSLIGAGIGLAGGALLGFAATYGARDSFWGASLIAVGVAYGGGAGCALGGLIGALAGSPDWEPVDFRYVPEAAATSMR